LPGSDRSDVVVTAVEKNASRGDSYGVERLRQDDAVLDAGEPFAGCDAFQNVQCIGPLDMVVGVLC
jgi:hypothetical protein